MNVTMAKQTSPAKKKRSRAESCAVFATNEQWMQRARKAMLDSAMAESIAAAFKSLSHPTRVQILRALSTGERCVCEVSEVLCMSISATTHQLSLLKMHRPVRSRSDGKQVYYLLSDRFVLELLNGCIHHLSEEEAA